MDFHSDIFDIMKKVLIFLVLLIVIVGVVKAQTPFTTPNLLTGGSTKITQNKGAGQFDSGLVVTPRFTDTASANLSVVSLYGGMLIRVLDTLWMRNESATRWNKMGGSVGSAGSYVDGIYRTPGIDSIYFTISGTTYAIKDSTDEDACDVIVDVLADIPELEDYSGNALTVIVTDSLRGGVFNYYSSGLTSDDGVVFSATGKGTGHWKRQMTESDALNVTWFGAVGDSLTDNSTALQTAINYAINNLRGKIYIPPGRYLYSTKLTIPSPFAVRTINQGLQLHGAGVKATYLIFTGSDTALVLRNNSATGVGDPASGIQYNTNISNFTLATAGADSAIGIFIKRYFNTRIEDMNITGFNGKRWLNCIEAYYDFNAVFPVSNRVDDYDQNLIVENSILQRFINAGYDDYNSIAGVQVVNFRNVFITGDFKNGDGSPASLYGIRTTGHSFKMDGVNFIACNDGFMTTRNPLFLDNNAISFDNCRWEGNLSSAIKAYYGTLINVQNSIIALFAGADSTVNTYLFYAPDSATGNVNYVKFQNCLISPNQRSPGANWVGIYAGTALNANAYFMLENCRQTFTPTGGVLYKTDGTAGIRWTQIRQKNAGELLVKFPSATTMRIRDEDSSFSTIDFKANGIYFGDGSEGAPNTLIKYGGDTGYLQIAAPSAIDGFIQATARVNVDSLNDVNAAINNYGKFPGKVVLDSAALTMKFSQGSGSAAKWISLIDSANIQTFFNKTVGNNLGFAQLGKPTTPSSGFKMYASTTGLSWLGSNGNSRTFNAQGITADRTYSLFDASDSLVGRTTTSTLTNKTLDGGSNTFTNIPQSAITGYSGYTLNVVAPNYGSPGDGTTNYFGNSVNTVGTTQGLARIYIPKSGTIKGVSIFIYVNGTLGSSETSSIYVRVNNTTDALISSSVTTDALTQVFNNFSMSQAVSQGDYVEIKWIFPTWSTNPTNVRLSGTIYIE